jgi:hypothetical protein
MTLRLNGSTSGFTEIDAPAVAGSNTLTLPGGNGTNGQVLTTDGAGALSFTTVAGAGSLADGSAAAPSVAFASDVNTGLFRAGSDALAFTTGGTERAQFDASGRLLVGTSTSVSVLGENKVQLFGENSGGSLSLTRTGATTQSANLVFGRTRGDASTRVSLNNDDVVGRIYFVGDDGTDIQTPAALIQVNVDGTPGANDMPGRIVLATTADGASSPTERMRITSGGRVGINTTDYNNGRFIVTSDSSAVTNTVFIESAAGAASVNTVGFKRGGSFVGTISTTSSATAYNTSSDYRLKENVTLLTGATDRLKQIPVHRFNFIADPDHTVDGFLAHEAQAVVPECVTGTKDEVEVWEEGDELPDGVSVNDNKLDEDGNTIPVYQGIDQSKLVPLLTAALQEAIAKIETLEARLTALEVTP